MTPYPLEEISSSTDAGDSLRMEYKTSRATGMLLLRT